MEKYAVDQKEKDQECCPRYRLRLAEMEVDTKDETCLSLS